MFYFKIMSVWMIGILLSQCVFAQDDTTQKTIAGRLNSTEQQSKPYVILISADGFRADLADKYQATNLLRLRQQGVAAPFMQASFPSLTFPNHYSIVTGLYPSHHGLVDNGYYDETRKVAYSMNNKKQVADSSWYDGTPLWVLAEKQQMLSASFYWVTSESPIQGVRPTYYYVYNEKIKMDDRINAVKKWLQLPENTRPHFITFYLPEVDHAEHTYGPDSKEAAEAVHLVDDAIGKLTASVDSLQLPVNFVFVSDHGMTLVDSTKVIYLPKGLDTTKFIVSRGDVVLHLYAKNKADVEPAYKALLKNKAKDYDVYLTTNMPAQFHYSKSDERDNRIGDIILLARPPAYFNIFRGKNTTIGKHGFDPALPDMHATFYAWGPAFKEHSTIKSFKNVNVYPLISKILGLTYNEADIDGKLEVLGGVLK